MSKAFLLDVDYVHRRNSSTVRLLLKKEKSTFRLYDNAFEPYFYVLPHGDVQAAKKRLEAISVLGHGETVKPKRVEEVEKLVRFKPVRLFRVVAFSPGHVPFLRQECKAVGETFEHDIPFYKRYLFDKGLKPCSEIEFSHNGKNILNPVPCIEDEKLDLNLLALDIETYNPKGIPDAVRDPCLMIGFCDGSDYVYSYLKKFSSGFVTSFSSEKEMLEKFSDVLKEKKADLLCTYNGDQFDLPYLQTRADRLAARLQLGRDHSKVKTRQLGLRKSSKIGGRIHYDVYPVVSFLNFIGTIKVQRLTLEKVYEEVLGGKKLDVKKVDIWKTWDQGSLEDLDHLADYCRVDARACYELTKNFLHLQLELSKLTGLTLFDSSRATASQLVEALLIRRSFERNELVPNKPDSGEVASRSNSPIEGAFVKLPEPGVYKNIAVLDFKSLYPSIIISHNIDASTLDCNCCSDAYTSPQGYRFCKKNKGIVPAVLGDILDQRFKIKDEMKKLDKESDDHKKLDGQQWGLKILANSFYGYLLYGRSRWYTRQGGEATTAIGRKYIQETIKKAEDFGFSVIYSDTDSVLLVYNENEEGKVIEFQKSVNKQLPVRMELELEDFYPRGIFVGKKVQGKKAEVGAKKKYALINKEGKIKIRGFELVRRDWSKVARSTQRQVLEIILREGDVAKAAELVRSVIADLKEGRVPLEDCVIWTQLRKKTSEYEVVSPEISAVLDARKKGLKIPEGAVVGYVVTHDGKSISEKARVVELARDYDYEYYVNNQVVPAVLKILGALGYDKDSIKMKGMQTGLGGW